MCEMLARLNKNPQNLQILPISVLRDVCINFGVCDFPDASEVKVATGVSWHLVGLLICD